MLVKYIKDQCSKVSQTKKVKCPKEKKKKEEETNYTSAFHAEGKKLLRNTFDED